MTKARHPQQEACLRQALGFTGSAAAAGDDDDTIKSSRHTTFMPKCHSLLLCGDANTFRRRMEALSLSEGRACREVVIGDDDDTTCTTRTTRSSSSSSTATSAAAASPPSVAAVLKFVCRASPACRFYVQAQQQGTNVRREGGGGRQVVTGWKIVRSQPHSCSEQEHAQFNLCSEQSLVYFFRNELPWVTLHCCDDKNNNNNNNSEQQDWTTLTQQFAAHLHSKYGIDYVCGGDDGGSSSSSSSTIRLRMLRRVLHQLTQRVATMTRTGAAAAPQSSNNSDRTQSPNTVVLENLPSHAAATTTTSARNVATSTTTTAGMKRMSTTAAVTTNSSNTTSTTTETSAIALRTRRRSDHPSVAAMTSTGDTTAASTSDRALKRKVQSLTRASKRSSRRTQAYKNKEKAASSERHVSITRSRSTLKRKAPLQLPTRVSKRSRLSPKQPTREQQQQPKNGASLPRRSLRREASHKQVAAVAPVLRDSHCNTRSNDVTKATSKATMQPVRKSQRVRSPSKKLQDSLATEEASQPTRATAPSHETRSQRTLRSRTTRDGKKDSRQAAVGPKRTPMQVLSVDEFLRDYDLRASSEGQLYFPLHLTGLPSSQALEIVREKLEELETQKKKLRAPPPPVDKQVEDDMRDYRRSLKSLSVLRENEMLMRHKEKEQDEHAYTQQRFFNRKQKQTPLALEVADMADRPIWWVNNSEFRRAASRKCCLMPAAAAAAAGGTAATCPLCSRPLEVAMTTATNAAPSTTLVPRIRQVDLDELEDKDEEEEGSRENNNNSSSNDDRRVSRAAETHAKVHATCAALEDLAASLAFVDNYNKTASLFASR